MTARGAGLLGKADLASLAQASGIALESYRQAHVSACVARALARHQTLSVAGLAQLCRRDPDVRATLQRSILVRSPGCSVTRNSSSCWVSGCCPPCCGPAAG